MFPLWDKTFSIQFSFFYCLSDEAKIYHNFEKKTKLRRLSNVSIVALKKVSFDFVEDAFIAKLEASKEKASRLSTSPAVKPPPQSPGPKSPLQSPSSSESYKFSQNCGDNIAMMLGGKKARRIE